MTHTDNHSEDLLRSQEAFEQMVKERLRQAVFLNAPGAGGG